MQTIIEQAESQTHNQTKRRNLLPKVTLFVNNEKFSRRQESWGSVVYDFKHDLFSAFVAGADPNITSEAPLAVYWLVNAPCNLKCIHCYGNVEELPGGIPNEVEQSRIADRIIESGAMRVTLNGGEPLLRRDTPSIIEKLADSNIGVILGTNGTYLTPQFMNSVRRANRVEISLDSHDELTNNNIRISRRNSGNAYRETLQAMELCLAHGVRLRILTCLNSYNHRDLPELARLLYERGVRDWSISWTLRAGRARHIYDELISTDETLIEEAIERIRQQYPEMKIKYSNRSNASLNNRYSCLVAPNGRVFAEDLQAGRKIMFNSLLEAPFSAAWNESNFNVGQHFKRWVSNRIELSVEGIRVSQC